MHISTFRVLLLVAMLLFATQSTQHSSAQVAQEKGGPPSYYLLLTSGMLAGPVFPYTFASGKFRVEVRNLIMGRAKASEVPTPADAAMELRGGAVTTTINGQSQERVEGDFWMVEKGSYLDIENKGQVAVIRAVYVYPGTK
jgi:hypothetical protein